MSMSSPRMVCNSNSDSAASTTSRFTWSNRLWWYRRSAKATTFAMGEIYVTFWEPQGNSSNINGPGNGVNKHADISFYSIDGVTFIMITLPG